MSSSSKRHYLNLQKANNRITENIISNYDNGATSVPYLLANSQEDPKLRNIIILKSIDQAAHSQKYEKNSLENDEKLVISNLDDWRKFVNTKALRTTSKRQRDETNQDERDQVSQRDSKKPGSDKKSVVNWEEVVQSPDRKCYINFILKKRQALKWNTKLPVYGAGVSLAMRNYQDQIVNEFNPMTKDDGEFVYCLPKHRNNSKIIYNPYDLEIVNESSIKNFNVYFTCSATYITMVYKNSSNETNSTPVMQWMWEQKLFDMLRSIRTFKLFRKWRTFYCLRANIRKQRNIRCKKLLHRRLFFANEIFQSALIHVRTLCERISSSQSSNDNKSNLIMVKCDPTTVFSLDDFFQIQDVQINDCLDILIKFKEEVMNIAFDSCITVGQMEGIDFDAFFNPESYFHQEIQITNFAESRYTRTVIMRDQNLNFQPQNLVGPSFIQKKEWRYVLKRLSEFLRSIDYLVQEMLHRIVKESIQLLHTFLFRSSNWVRQVDRDRADSLISIDTLVIEEKIKKSVFEEPISGQYDTAESVEKLLEEIKAQRITEKIPESIFQTELVLNVDQRNINIDSESDDEESSPKEMRRKSKVLPISHSPIKVRSPTSTKISKESTFDVYLTISPNENEFKNSFHDLIVKCEQTVGKIQTLLYEPKFSMFVDTPDYELTETEKTLKYSGDNQLKKIPWPEVEFLFGEDVDYQDVVSDIMRIVDTCLRNTLGFVKNYEQYCQMVSSFFKLNIDDSINEKIWSPDEFQMVLAKYTEQISSIESMIINKRIGFIHLMADSFKDNSLPYPKRVINVIDKFLPPMAVQRNEKLQETIRDALKLLDRDPSSVEEFVEHLSVLSKINNELPTLENEFLTVSRLFSIAHEFNLSISPENYAFFKSLGSTFQHLKSSLLYTEAQCEDNIRKFTVDLNNMIAKVYKESIDLKARLQSPRLLSLDTTPQVANENLKLFDEMIQKFIEQAKNYAAYQERFGNTIKQVKKKLTTDYLMQDYGSQTISILKLQTELNEIEHDINLRKLLWKSIEEWEIMVKDWLEMILDEIKVDNLQKDMNRFTQNIFLLEKGLPHNDLVPKLKEKIFDFKKAMPIIVALRNPNLKKRHWIQLRGIISRNVMDNENLSLGMLLEADVLQFRDKISDVSSLATNEATLETMLNKIIDVWKKTDFRLVADTSKDTFIITSTEEISILLEESQLTMATIKSSRYVGPIKTLVEDWDRKLVLFAKTLEEWIEFQKKWLYLEQIFTTPDIQRQLQTETKIFLTVDKFWRELMRKTDEKPNAMRAATTPGLLESLQTNNLQMEKIQRSLEDYFETKRLVFPRLYFLSNEDLLDILSQSKDPLKIQTHLNKFFGNIRSIELSIKQSDVYLSHVVSVEGEKLELIKPLKIRGASEQWLLALENSIFDTVKRYLKQGLADNQTLEFEEWLLRNIGQVVLTVGQINFNKKVLLSFSNEMPTRALESFKNQLITSINLAANMASKDIPSFKVQSIEALLTIDVHSRDILTSLINNKITSPDDFEWTRNLRYEWEEFNNQCSVLHSNAAFSYGYEYLGCSPRLVITPLTDRCYLTLTGALKLNLGGAPAGPAGTGKTETVKDLAKSIGKLCLVFNCSESLDYKILGKFFSGIAQSGSWCCFDEFNRIDIEVLSVVSQQILTIKTAKDANAPRLLFEGREIKLNISSGIFITMNPTYAGRVELPDNLKPLFRPVAMMVPDYALIAEIILFSVGFTSAKILSQKIVTLYHLATRQLSQQDHYDFGMRAIKSVLLMAGQVKKNWIAQNESKKINEEEESQVLMQSLFDTNLPKFLKDDAVLFQNLMNDLFPVSKKSKKKQDLLEKSILTATRELGYQSTPTQTEKIIQLYNQMIVRHGIMLVGPTGGGKSVARNILHRAVTLMPSQHQIQIHNDENQKAQSKIKKNKVETIVINPKSITIDELYGYSDLNTLEWFDGILGSSVRSFTNQPIANDTDHDNQSSWQWIILDGPVDTFWVENLNSVLDDSKVLCLSNGERIYLNSTTRLFFEVDSLINTSPATVSRCAMVYFEPADLDIYPYIKNWFLSLPKEVPASGIELLNELMDFSFNKGFDFIYNRKQSTHFHVHKHSIIQTLCAILKSFLDFFANNGGFGQKDVVDSVDKQEKSKNTTSNDILLGKKQYFLQRNPKQLGSILTKIFIFSYYWSFGGLLKREDNVEDDNIINQKSQVKSVSDSLTQDFDEFIRELFESNVKYGIHLPPNVKPVFDYFIDIDGGNFVEWNQLVPSTDTLIRKGKDDQIVDTIDLVRYSFITTLLLKSKHPVLLTGTSGVGKTVTMQNMLKRLALNGYSFKPNTILGDVFNFSDKNKASILESLTTLMNEDATTSTSQIEAKKTLKFEDYTILTNSIQFSAQTDSKKFLNILTSRLTKKGHNILGAPKNKWIVTFIDDLNLPIADKYGDQAPLELFRFILENNGILDPRKNSFKNISDITFVACCDPPSSGRAVISPRLLRQFCILALPEPSARSLLHIYQVQLGKFFSELEFSSEIKLFLPTLVSASVVMWYRILINMLPTPNKSHYIFNLRDLSKLIRGLMQAHPMIVVNKDNLVNLFAHECIRVFCDRLITDEDKNNFYMHLNDTTNGYFKTGGKNFKFSNDENNVLLYGDFLKPDDRVYQPISDWKQLVSVLSEYQIRYNMSGASFQKIVFFKEASEHICRACRILRQAGGHLLLIGLDGIGKFKTIELASFICNAQIFKLNIKKGYNYEDFRDDLREVFKLTGVHKKKVILFITDKDIYEESFLEDLDSLLSSGNVPDLFDSDALESITGELRTDAAEAGLGTDRNELYKFLIQRVQNHLHVVLSMSPAGNELRERCRFHPALINCTTIDWFNDWNDHAMEQVSEVFMENMDFNIGTNQQEEKELDELKQIISKTCVHIHKTLVEASHRYYEEHKRHYYVTPSFYMDLLRNFERILDERKTEYLEKLARLRKGLQKLSEANDLVALMKQELITLGPQIEEKAIETENLMSKLLKDQEAVNEVRSIVSKEEEKMRNETDMVQEYANEAEKELNDVIPVLQAATESLETLKKSDISEIRVYTSPPFLVMTVMFAVCVILQKKPDWTTAKQLLADSGFINKLINFDKNSITDKVYIKIKQFSKNPDFTPEIVGTVSIACKSLCSWVIALQRYHEVHRTVKPKEDKVKEAKEALTVMQNGLKKKQKMLSEIQGHLDGLQAKYEESLNERKLFENRKEMIRLRLERASELTKALETEKVRWTEQFEELSNGSSSIIGTSLIYAASVNYLGALTQDYRAELLQNWISFCLSNNLYIKEDFDLTKHIIPQHIIRNWIAHQLPDDQYSIENAIFIKNSVKWPLIIDPEEQATRWIREMERSSLKSVKSEDPSLFRVLEQAIRLGESILIENIGESLDPALDPIIKKEIITKGAQRFIQLGDVEVDYNDSFKLYLTTSLPNPHYLPSTFIKVNLINFTITFKCLTEQFLSLVVLKERPELEAERVSLMESISNDTMTLRALEDKSLSMLSSTGSSNDSQNTIDSKTLLDDQNLIDVLKDSKATSADISVRLSKNEETEKRLNLARQKYSSIATRGAILYFVIKSLSTLNVMYQFSLNWFYSVFQSCLGSSQNSIENDKTSKTTQQKLKTVALASSIARNTSSLTPPIHKQLSESPRKLSSRNENELDIYINSILDILTNTVYKVVSWVLFAEHQLLFSFSLCVNILKNNMTQESISNDEHNYFMNSSIIADLNHERLSEKIKSHNFNRLKKDLMLDEKIIKEIILLEEMFPIQFESILENMEKNSDELWLPFKNNQDPYNFMKIAENNTYFKFDKLTKFQRLILIKLIRKDFLINAIQSFIIETLGKYYLSPGVPTIQELFNQSSSQRPIIFILSPGSDPASSLLRFAKETRGSTLHMDIISLGQGQGPRAEELITKSLILKGRWIFLQNCHLAASFMPRLQNLVSNFSRPGAEIDSQFRLFLSSKPTSSFPVSLLQAGIKMTIEPPRGLKNNLKQNFASGGIINKQIFDEKENGTLWRRLVFNLGLFHGVIHERKKFGPLGWNLAYEFNNSDLEVALLQLQAFLTSNDNKISFNVLKYITGEVIYGGRVTDDFDRRCLLSILGIFFSDESISQDYFYAANNNDYKAPSLDIDYSSIVNYIERLPENDDPRVFGMNIYAENMLLSQRANHLIASISMMEPSKSSTSIGTNTSDNEVVLKFCEEISSSLPEAVIAIFDKKKHLTLAEAFTKLPERLGNSYYENAALLSILRQEIDRFNRLLNVIHKTINDLTKALKGEIIISKSLENVFQSILLQKVPIEWEKYSYPSLKSLILWLKDLIKRVQFFSLWSKTVIVFAEGSPTQIYPYSFWISAFFFPQGLLTAISQNYARKLKVSIDSLKFKFEIQNNLVDDENFDIHILFDTKERYGNLVNRHDLNGILINGFFIDGARWNADERALIDSESRCTAAPYFLARIVMESDVHEDSNDRQKFKCPVYRNSIRAGSPNDQAKNFVTTIELDCKENPDFWILRGTCMILQTDN